MTLTLEQQRALDQLLAYVPAAPRPTEVPDFFRTWLGLSSGEIKTKLLRLLDRKRNVEQQLRDIAENNPLDSALGFLTAASLAFYAAEKDVNPKVKTYVDAFYYISTCASVGYADIFAMTQPGRAIAAFVMIVGPALADRSLNRPRSGQ